MGDDDPGMDRPRRERADARCNRARILAAARRVFDEAGPSASTDLIAERAGVGKGTLYRRFSRKQDLIEAIFADRFDELGTLTARLADQPPWPALCAFLAAAARFDADHRGLLDTLARHGDGHLLQDASRRFTELAAAPLRRAQQAGAVRPDLTVSDLAMIIYMLGAVHRCLPDDQHVTGGQQRYLTLLLDAIRADHAATPLAGEQ